MNNIHPSVHVLKTLIKYFNEDLLVLIHRQYCFITDIVENPL